MACKRGANNAAPSMPTRPSSVIAGNGSIESNVRLSGAIGYSIRSLFWRGRYETLDDIERRRGSGKECRE